jgi:hypothetical protein
MMRDVLVGRVEDIRRMASSDSGNPRWRLVVGGKLYETAPNINGAYALDYESKGKLFLFGTDHDVIVSVKHVGEGK